MTRKAQPAIIKEQPKLLKPRAEVAANLKTMLEETEALLNKLNTKHISTEVLKGEYDELIEAGTRLVRSFFNNDQESQLFKSTRTLFWGNTYVTSSSTRNPFGGTYYPPASDGERDHLQGNIKATIRYLSALLKSLNAFEEAQTDNDHFEDLSPKSSREAIIVNVHNNPQLHNNSSNVNNNHSEQAASNIIKNDFESLAAALRLNGVNQYDLQELETAIKSDPPHPSSAENLGPKVKEWIGNMVLKVSNKIAIPLLKSALVAFYFDII